MVNLKVIRKWPKAAYTVGRFYVGTAFFGNSMEDADRGLWQTMPLAEIQRRKVWGETAIPKGSYVVKLTYSAKVAKLQKDNDELREQNATLREKIAENTSAIITMKAELDALKRNFAKTRTTTKK